MSGSAICNSIGTIADNNTTAEQTCALRILLSNRKQPDGKTDGFYFDLKARTGERRTASTSMFDRRRTWKEKTMRETIRFAWGISSLGDFVVAMSEKGTRR